MTTDTPFETLLVARFNELRHRQVTQDLAEESSPVPGGGRG
ncbi:MAG: hypothetical protein Q9O74_09050 [Planctomycetota bacterium]|nr:hypothetical protein [Planctomycetota bacterium]